MLYLCWSHLSPRAPKAFEGWVSAISCSVPNDNVQCARLCSKERERNGVSKDNKELCLSSSKIQNVLHTHRYLAPCPALSGPGYGCHYHSVIPCNRQISRVFVKVVATELQHELLSGVSIPTQLQASTDPGVVQLLNDY